MPPFVDPASPAALPSQSASSELLSRSRSADDLMQLKTLALAATANGRHDKKDGDATATTTATRSQSAHSKSPPSSMEWVGSYFFQQSSCNQGGVHQYSEDEHDLAVVHMSPESGDADDESTVGAHFVESDFVTSHWTSAVEYIPPVGLAVVAGGLCMLNPIVFIGGILTACTALGAVHAAQTSYDTCIEGDLCQIFDKNAAEEGEENKKKGSGEGEAQDLTSPDPLKREVSDVTFNMTGMEDAVSEVDLDRMMKEQSLLAEVRSGETPLPQDPSILETSEQALEWVNQYYPPLVYNNVDNLEFAGLNALEFFDVFLADDAPFTFAEFQKKRQDKNIRYGKWEDLEGVTQPSLVQAAATIASPAAKDDDGSPMLYHTHLKERVLHFQAKTNSGLFGPPYATTIKVQRCLIPNKRLLVLESKTNLKDIPFCDRFFVLERWLVTSQKRNDQYVSNVSVTCQVVFSKSCSFASTILSKSQDTVTDIALHWNGMAQKALQRTEQARQERLLQDAKTTTSSTPTESAPPPPSAAAAAAVGETTSSTTTTNAPAAKMETESMDSSIEVERLSRTDSRILGRSADEEDTPVITNHHDDEQQHPDEGRPPKIPNPSGKNNKRRQASVRRSLGRSLSNMMKRRNSNPL